MSPQRRSPEASFGSVAYIVLNRSFTLFRNLGCEGSGLPS